ncbi:MAG: chemotaxis protein [Roseiarcus sp.]
MVRSFVIAAASAAVIALSPAAFAQQTRGTADEARAMLMKALAAVQADRDKALDMFNKGEGGFRDRDLYVFCVNASDGTVVAIGNPNLKQALGTDVRTAQNSTGKAFGAEIYAAIQKPEGQITEVDYVSPEPSPDDALAAKVTLVARADDDLGCGVGYYK